MHNPTLRQCSPYHGCWQREREGAGTPRQLHPGSQAEGKVQQSDGKRGDKSQAETFLHPGSRWDPFCALGWGWQKQQERPAQSGKRSWVFPAVRPLSIKPLMSQRGGLVCLILSGGRTLIYAALGSPLPCRFTRRFSMRAASLTEIKGSPLSPRYYAQTHKSGLNI